MATAQVLRSGLPGQPDINYAPNFDKYLARTKRQLETGNLERTLPSAFPHHLESDLVWEGTDISAKYEWTYELESRDIEEIEAGLSHFRCLSHMLPKFR